MVAVEEVLHPLWEVVELFEDELDLLRRQRSPNLSELERDQRQQRRLRRERLRCSDADLEACTGVQDGVDLACDLRAELVRDREGACPLFARVAHRGDRVGRFMRLTDACDERGLRQATVSG